MGWRPSGSGSSETPTQQAQGLRIAVDPVRDYGASGSQQNTTGTMSAGSKQITLASAIDFENGHGIFIPNAGQIPNPAVPTLSQVSGSSTFTAGEQVYVALAVVDSAGNYTLASPATPITISTAGNLIQFTAQMPMFGVKFAIYAGTSSTPLEVGTIDGGLNISYSGGLSAGIQGTVSYGQRQYTITISAVASGTGAAQPASNATVVPLVSKVQSGAGTTTLTLADSAVNAVTSVTVNHDDTDAIQSALNAVSSNGGGVVVSTKPFHWISQVLTIGDNTTLDLSYMSTTIKRQNGTCIACDAQVIQNADMVNGNSGLRLIGGTYDGNTANSTRLDTIGGRYVSGVCVRVFNSDQFKMQGVTLKDPVTYGGDFGQLTHFAIEDIIFDYTNPVINNDGIDIHGLSNNGVIRNCVGNTGDDMIAINAEYGVVGEIKDINIEGLHADSGYRAVRFLGVNYPIHNVAVSKVTGSYANASILFSDYNLGAGNMYAITLNDINSEVSSSSSEGIVYIDGNVTNLTINGMLRTQTGSGGPSCIQVASGKTITTLEATNINYNDETSGGSLLMYVAGTITNLMLSNVQRIRSSGTGGHGILVSGGVITNMTVNGFLCLYSSEAIEITSGGQIASLSLTNIRGYNTVNGFVYVNASTLNHLQVANADIGSMTYFLNCAGTLGAAVRVFINGMHLDSTVTTPINKGTATLSLVTSDFQVDVSTLTPTVGDVCNNNKSGTTAGPAYYNGTNWISMVDGTTVA